MSASTDNGSMDEAVQRAVDILTELSAVPPRNATASTVERLAEAAGLLESRAGSSLWFLACDRWASHLLEVKSGDHHANVMAARAIYGAMVAQAADTASFDDWYAAHMGLGNTLLFDPAAGPEDLAAAAQYFDALAPVVRESGSPMQAALALGRAADAHSRAQSGDVDGALERAITLQSEVVDLLSNLADPDLEDRLAHAHYNLGRFYAQRRTGVRSQNIDRAIQALLAARDLRPADRDPTGRARVLRALAQLLPEWSAPSSKAHAEQLAEEAEQEAATLAAAHTGIGQYENPVFTGLQRSHSALRADFDWLYEHPPEQRRGMLEEHIQYHRRMLDGIDRTAMPVVWAEWAAGLGRLLGRLAHVGASGQELAAAHRSFQQAAASVDADAHTRLYRDIMAGWGEFSHETGDFEASYHAYSEAAAASGRIMTAFADPVHRLAEIERTRGYGLFGAYAAVRLGRPVEAARLAELECNRGIADLLNARSVMAAAAPDRRAALAEVLDRIRLAEGRLREAQHRAPDALAEDMRGRIADAVGLNPALLQVRLTDAGSQAADGPGEDIERLREELAGQRERLQALLHPSTDSGEPAMPPHADIDDITGVAASIGQPLAYLLATVHGGAAVLVMPSGTVEGLPLPGLTSDLTRDLLHGDGEIVGFRDIEPDEVDAAEACLLRIADVLLSVAIGPLTEHLRAGGDAGSFVLVALGRLGVLPLHLAAADLPLSYASSARLLAGARPADGDSDAGAALAVANPSREDAEPLPFAMAEGRWLSKLTGAGGRARLLADVQAAFGAVREAAAGARLIHFACHGHFRPSAPLESGLELAGEDELKLADLFLGTIDVSRARLVTLGACDSGLSEYYRASDEATGFPLGLMLAGVPAVVNAMWPVEDAAAMLFMTRFYELLLVEGFAPAAAVAGARHWLRTARVPQVLQKIAAVRASLVEQDTEVMAQLDALNEDLRGLGVTAVPFASPLDWGAFCLTGA